MEEQDLAPGAMSGQITALSILFEARGEVLHRITLHGRPLPGQLDLRGLSWLPTADQPFGYRPTWLPDGRLAFVERRRLVAVGPLSGRRTVMGPVLLPPGSPWLSGSLLSPDGREIVVPRAQPEALLIEDVRTGRVIDKVPVTQLRDWSPTAWWPDSRSLLLFNLGTWEVALLEVQTGRVAMLPALRGGIYEATWSPDGSTLAFTPHIPGTCVGEAETISFFRKNNAHGPKRDIIPSAADPIWARDGKTVAYTRIEPAAQPCAINPTDVWVAPLR
jgi:hypothetical protein